MYKYLIIDGNNWYARNWYTHDKTSITYDGTLVSTGGIYGFFRSLLKWERKFLEINPNNLLMPKGQVYILFDNCTSKINNRRDIDPEYKKLRENNDDTYYAGIDMLQMILLHYGMHYRLIYKTQYEADDLVFPLQQYLRSKGTGDNRMLLISEDMDWARGISEDTDWFAKDQVFNLDSFKDTYGYTPTCDHVIFYKALRGDSSDGIPKGIRNLSEEKLLGLIKRYHSLDRMMEMLDTLEYVDYDGEIQPLSQDWINKFHENKGRIMLNKQLIDFLPLEEEDFVQNIYKSRFTPATLDFIFNTLAFNIAHLDPRVIRALPREEFTFDNFFKEIPTERAKS